MKQQTYPIQIVDPKQLLEVIENRSPLGCFLAKDGDKWVAVDNTSYDAWTEEFSERSQAIHWLRGEFEVGDLSEQWSEISETGELIAAALKQGISLKKKEADRILGYLEGHDYNLLMNNKGMTIRHDKQYRCNHRRDEPYSIQETIEFCRTMNEELLDEFSFSSKPGVTYLLRLWKDKHIFDALRERLSHFLPSLKNGILQRRRQEKMPKEDQKITIFAIVHTAADADRGYFCDPEISGCYLSLSAAKEDWQKQIAEEKALLDGRYNCEECEGTCWETYQDGYAAACFSRIEILSAKLYGNRSKGGEE